jgi:NlpC/P60 family putative phage cell wall peptidase
MTPEDVIVEARSWLGTPYHHQAALKGVGCDCVGLLRGVYNSLTGSDIQNPENYSPAWHIHKGEEKLYGYLKNHFNLKEKPAFSYAPGDILIFGVGAGPGAHAAIVTAADRMIHSYREIGKVVENQIDTRWSRRIRFCFEFPGVFRG